MLTWGPVFFFYCPNVGSRPLPALLPQEAEQRRPAPEAYALRLGLGREGSLGGSPFGRVSPLKRKVVQLWGWFPDQKVALGFPFQKALLFVRMNLRCFAAMGRISRAFVPAQQDGASGLLQFG